MFLIIGATGVVGRPLVDVLLAEGARVRAVSRTAGAAGLPAEVELVAGDPRRPETLAEALRGVSALFVHPRAVGDGEAAGKLVALAAEQGVRRVVAMSAINVEDEPAHQPSRFNGDRNKEVEEAVVRGGLPWVSVRPTSFAVNTIATWAGQIRAGNVVRGPYATFAEALIHERDLAEVIARALQDDRLDGRRIPVTGPRSLTHEEMVVTIGEVIGRPLSYAEIPPEIAAQGMTRFGLPEPFVHALMERYARGAGRPAIVTPEEPEILGRPARTFADWVADHRESFAEGTGR
jgi:uncharacterized protein YbjT (DUF2867 family)